MDELTKILTSGSATTAGPQILVRGQFIANRISEVLKTYCSMFPEEVQAIGEHCAALRAGAEWKGTFSDVIYNSKDKDMAFTMKVPETLNLGMCRVFHDGWMSDPEIMNIFVKYWKIGAIKGTPRPDITSHVYRDAK